MSEVEKAILEALQEFQALRIERHAKGEEKYGHLTYLGNDVIRMMLEELADLVNYAEYQAAKILMLQRLLEEDPRLEAATKDNQITIGVEAFKGTKEGWKQ
jgi:uncharacterized protein YqgQ